MFERGGFSSDYSEKQYIFAPVIIAGLANPEEAKTLEIYRGYRAIFYDRHDYCSFLTKSCTSPPEARDTKSFRVNSYMDMADTRPQSPDMRWAFPS